MRQILFSALMLLMCLDATAKPEYGISMHDKPKYGPKDHFDYVNINAPIGGELRVGVVGTFDTLHPYVIKGQAPSGLNIQSCPLFYEPLVYEQLMIRSTEEPFSLYGRIAETVEMAPDRSWIQFNLDPRAKWADGQAITAEDVEFSYITLRDKGRPNQRLFYKKVKSVEMIGPRSIKFTFDKLPDEDRYDPEIPLIMGLMPVLPRHILKDKDYEKLTQADMVGSGPYKIAHVDMGRSITYERRDDYWGWGHPKIKGHYNFKTMRFDYYRNAMVAREAFKAGEYDVLEENDPNVWANELVFKAAEDGRVTKAQIAHSRGVGFKAFVFNTRREVFSNIKVREALSYAFDFEWANKTLYQGGYTRTRSIFDGTELRDPEQTYKPPQNPDAKALREHLTQAGKMLDEAGWVIKNGMRVHKETGKPLQFEILLYQPIDEKLALAYARNLQRLGVKANVRVVDAAQYEKRRLEFDYDMIINMWYFTLSPGREQTYYWGSKFATEPGSRNYPGIQDPRVDELCNKLAMAPTRQALISTAHELDRALLSGHYVVSLFHNEKINLAYWNKLGHPRIRPDVGVALITWWCNDTKKTGK